MRITAEFWKNICKGAPTEQEAVQRCLTVLRKGLAEGKFHAEEVSWYGLFYGLGLASVDVDPVSSLKRLQREQANLPSQEHLSSEQWLAEASGATANIMSTAFNVLTNELISNMIISAYNGLELLGDKLVTVVPVSRQATKMAGVSHLGFDMVPVEEGHPYPETDLAEKYVTTSEKKYGRVLSVSEEMVLFDQTGLIRQRASVLGQGLKEGRNKLIVQAVTGQLDSASTGYYVYRPSGVGETLYNTDGSNRNYIGSGNTTSSSFASAVPLVDHTDIDTILEYRMTEVVDDRIDGTKQPIEGLNNGDNMLLVSPSKLATAKEIYRSTTMEHGITASGDERKAIYGNQAASYMQAPETSVHLSGADYYYGNFKKQFMWTEIWPLQTFTQGRESEGAFTNDTVLKYKARLFGGVSAVDTVWVTKVDGA